MIAKEIGGFNAGEAPVYIPTAIAMRPLNGVNDWVMITFGFWSDDVQVGYRGILAVCRSGTEENIGKRFVKEVSDELRCDMELWALKQNTGVVLSGAETNIEYKSQRCPPHPK